MNSKVLQSTVFGAITLLVMVVSLPVLAGGGHDHGSDAGHTTDGPYEISLETHPGAGAIIPDGDLVETIVSVRHDGEPARNVTLSYRLDAPPKRFWFGTDFPVVEGTPLLQGTVPLEDGSQMFELIYPIRGNYTLRATAEGPEGVSKKTFTIAVSENPQEKVNLAIFLLVLFLIGGLGGWFLTSGTSSRPTAAVLALLGVGLMLGNPGQVLAHGKGSYNPDVLEQRTGTHGHTDDYTLDIHAFPQPVKVGELLDVSFRVKQSKDDGHVHGHTESGTYRAEVDFIHEEGGKKFVGQSVVLDEGRASFGVQLFDGAPHYMMTKVYRPLTAGEDHHDGHEGHDHGDAEKNQAESDGDDHGHGHGPSEPWEWQGQVGLSAGDYTIAFAGSGDPAMKWVLLPVDTDHRRQTAVELMKESCQSVSPGTVIDANETCYNLTLEESGTTHKLTVETGGTYRLYTQHVPDEFDMTIKGPDGKPVDVTREFYPGKGELILTDIRKVDVQPVHPPVDDIVKVMLTLLGVAGLGFLGAWRLKVAMG